MTLFRKSTESWSPGTIPATTYLITKIKSALKYVFALFFLLAGLNHFRVPDFYTKMIPPYLPYPLFLVYLSGAFEVVLGVALLVPRCRKIAARGIIALLVAVFPANIHMAVNPGLFPAYSPATLWARLPLQVVFVVWAFWYTRADAIDRAPRFG